MSQASDSDLLARSLSGDWQARVNLYKKFVHTNLKVRRAGARCPSLDDFLHDVFTNFLRVGHSFPKSARLSESVEAVAVWTALERERLRDPDSSDPGSYVRMCAAIEVDEGSRGQLASYVPPRSSPDVSLAACISAIVGEPQFTLIRARAMENATWEGAASAAGMPTTTVGPVFVRAVSRLLRFFGAPPPLNPDLEHVFFDVSASDAVARHANPMKPRGRVISMQLDPAFYAVTPEIRKIGLTLPSEVRTVSLWDAARASAPPGDGLRDHLANCRYCMELLRSLLLMQQAVLSETNTEFLLCPGASTLLQDSDEATDAFSQHLAECPLCRDEQTRALTGDDRGTASKPRAVNSKRKLGKKFAWAAGSAVILSAMVIGLYYFYAEKQPDPASPGATQDAAEVTFNSNYADLAKPVAFDDPRLVPSFLLPNQPTLIEASKHLNSNDGFERAQGKVTAENFANSYNDPGAEMLFAECLYSEDLLKEGYRAAIKAEAMPPRNSFRCWVTLQYALMAGDKATAAREIGHLSTDPEYEPAAKAILAKILERK